MDRSQRGSGGLLFGAALFLGAAAAVSVISPAAVAVACGLGVLAAGRAALPWTPFLAAGWLAGMLDHGPLPPPRAGPERMVVAFNDGWFRGVTCVVQVAGQTVRCRFRSEGALGRKLLGEARRTVAGRLGAAGFELGDYEVGS